MTCLIGIYSLCGWAILAIYLGTGLVYFPFRLVLNWFNRPRKLDKNKYQNLKKQLCDELKIMIELANHLKGILQKLQIR